MIRITQNALRLFFLLALTNGVGYVGSSFMNQDAMNWYDTLSMSSLTPPEMVFPIVWFWLFLMMSIGAFLVWNKVSPRYFVAQLAMNLLWTFLFFGQREVVASCFVIVAMLYFLYRCMRDFYAKSPIAAYLMAPTFVWSLFALYLNVFIVINN